MFKNVREDLKKVIDYNFTTEQSQWLNDKIEAIILNKSTKDLYLTYSLMASTFRTEKTLMMAPISSDVGAYLKNHRANELQLARIYMLVCVLESDDSFFLSKVSNIIQIADTTELETFLKYLVFMPHPEAFKQVAMDALRTNITPVFDAISLNNPYPALYFDNHAWNQMYLKAAFMQRDLSSIVDIDRRANKDLARIISDYAHERWAASRDIDPYFWRPVASFLDDTLLKDMEKLFQSTNEKERLAAALCCAQSENQKASTLLNNKILLKQKVAKGLVSWDTIN